MSYKSHVTVRELILALANLPLNTIIDIASDPEINKAGPVAMLNTGELNLMETKLRSTGDPVLILWPLETRMLDDRYNLDED